MFAGGDAEPDEQMGLAGAGVTDQHDGVAGVEVGAGGQRGDGRRVDRRGDVDVEVGEAFDAREAGFVDPSGAASFGAVVDLDGEGVGEESEVGGLGSLRLGGEPAGVLTDAGQVQLAGGGLDRGDRGGVGGGHRASSSWS